MDIAKSGKSFLDVFRRFHTYVTIYMNVFSKRIFRIGGIAVQIIVISTFDQMNSLSPGTEDTEYFLNQRILVPKFNVTEKVTAENGIKTIIRKRQLCQSFKSHYLIVMFPCPFDTIRVKINSDQKIRFFIFFQRHAVRSTATSKIKHTSP